MAQYPLRRRLIGFRAVLDGRKILPPPGFDRRTVRLVSSRDTGNIMPASCWLWRTVLSHRLVCQSVVNDVGNRRRLVLTLVGAVVPLDHLIAWVGHWGLGLTQRLLGPTMGWSWDCSYGSLLLCSSPRCVPGGGTDHPTNVFYSRKMTFLPHPL